MSSERKQLTKDLCQQSLFGSLTCRERCSEGRWSDSVRTVLVRLASVWNDGRSSDWTSEHVRWSSSMFHREHRNKQHSERRESTRPASKRRRATIDIVEEQWTSRRRSLFRAVRCWSSIGVWESILRRCWRRCVSSVVSNCSPVVSDEEVSPGESLVSDGWWVLQTWSLAIDERSMNVDSEKESDLIPSDRQSREEDWREIEVDQRE